MNKKIVMSLSVIAAVAAVVIGGTSAFFSDSETSTGNTFTAGAIDLSIGSQFSSNGNANGGPTVMPLLADNNGRALYTFTDLKPGDFGSGAFELNVSSNAAYVCAMTDVTGTPENTVVEPEQSAGDVTNGANDGELQNFLQFAIFADLDGDGMRDAGEPLNVNQYGGDSNGFTAAEMEAMGWIAVADPSSPNTWLTIASLAPNTPYDAGFMYCFGNFDANGVCTMSPSTNDNLAQTDGISGSLTFQAVQTRNNAGFLCSSLNPEGQKVGANLGAYVAPSCTVTVTDGNSIQAAIDAAAAGSTICVGPGTHDSDTYPLRVNEDSMTLASTGGAGVTTLNGGVILDNDGTKVTGFTLSSSTLLGETFGVYINTGVDGAVVSFNDMNGPGVGSGRGVVNAIGTTTNATIANNEISNYLTGVFMNMSSGMVVELNDLVSNGVGSGNDNPTSNSVRKNQITGNTIEGVGVLSSGAESIAVNLNNIFGNGGSGNELNSYAVDVVDAENNWWGDATPADEIGGAGSGSVDFSPFAASAYAQN